MIHLSEQTLRLARRLADARGVSLEQAIHQALERSVAETGDAPSEFQSASPEARRASMRALAEAIARLPRLDTRPIADIVDDLHAL